MLYVSLFLSALVLFIALNAFRSPKGPSILVSSLGAAIVGAPCLLGCFLPAVALQIVLLAVVMSVGSWKNWRVTTCSVLGGVATLAGYGIIGFFAARDVAELQEKYPYASMEQRLHEPKRHLGEPLPDHVSRNLESVEELIASSGELDYMAKGRTQHLEKLHEHTLQVFVNRPGFGVMRMRSFESIMNSGRWADRPVPQPGSPRAFVWSSGDLEGPSPHFPQWDYDESWDMHADGLVDFVNRKGFGYFKDRRHVAGFESHRFSQVPTKSAGAWKLQTIELVGLVQHDEPVVYMTENLPRMEEVRGAPRRRLDDFEAAGLKALTGGEDLFVRDQTEGRRMLGAIRNAKQCVSCHGGQRGDLLGAFSYTLSAGR